MGVVGMEAVKSAQELVLTSLIFFAIFVPFVQDWIADLRFVAWLSGSFVILVIHLRFRFVLPAYWASTLFALTLPAFYTGVPTMLSNTALLTLFRAWHVGLLTSRSGYGTDVTLFRSNKLFTTTLTLLALTIDVLGTFYIMRGLGFSTPVSTLMAAIAPAPSPEVALPLFDHVSSACAARNAVLKDGTEAQSTRAEKIAVEMVGTLRTFKTTALALILITIGAFCAVANGLGIDSTKSAVTSAAWDATVLGALIGVVIAVVFSVLLYIVGSLVVPKDASPQTVALLLFCTGGFSMFYLGIHAPVASALAAIGGCLCLRWSIGFSDETSSILSMFWAFTSHLYYSTFAYCIVGYYTLRLSLISEIWLRMLAGSILPSFVKLVGLSAVSRVFKVSWPSSLILASSLCSKGTVQIALSVSLLLKSDLRGCDDCAKECYDVQLFVLMSYLFVLPLTRALTYLTTKWIRYGCGDAEFP